jgi:hypothetical protein
MCNKRALREIDESYLIAKVMMRFEILKFYGKSQILNLKKCDDKYGV